MSNNTTTETKPKTIECSEENARKFYQWIKTRGGVATWKSINLSNPGAEWSTPATIPVKDLTAPPTDGSVITAKRYCPNCRIEIAAVFDTPELAVCNKCGQLKIEDCLIRYPKPTWQAGNEPLIVTDPANVIVYTHKLYKAFRVGLRHGDGLSFRLTDGAQRKVDKYLDRCKEEHGDSFYRKGVLDIDGASIGIYYTGSTTTLDKWIAEHGEEEKPASSYDTKRTHRLPNMSSPKHWTTTQRPHKCEACGQTVTSYIRKATPGKRIVVSHNLDTTGFLCPGSQKIIPDENTSK